LPKEYKISIQNQIVGLERVETEQPQVQAPMQSQSAQTEALASKTSKFGSASKAIAIHMGKQALNYALSNYGNLTGDHITQARISETLELAGLIAMAASGPVGMVAAAGNVAIKAFNRYIDVRKSEIQANALKVRTGGSRNEN
jgi:hypothetical protein